MVRKKGEKNRYHNYVSFHIKEKNNNNKRKTNKFYEYSKYNVSSFYTQPNHTYINTYLYEYMYIYVRVPMYTYIHLGSCIYIHMYVYVYEYIYINEMKSTVHLCTFLVNTFSITRLTIMRM